MTLHTQEERELADRIGDALEKAYPGQVNRFVNGAEVTLTIPAADRSVGTDDNTPLQLGRPLAETPSPSKKVKAGPISADRLKAFVERIEKLEEERKAISGDIKDVYSEAKGVGYDVKTMRKIVQLRRMDAADRAEQETLLDVYKHALGMV